MKRTFLKYALSLALLLALAGVSYFSWAYINDKKEFKIVNSTPVVEKLTKIKYDTALLAKFEKLSKQLDPHRNEYSIIGKLVFRDGADSAAKAQQVDYEVRKKGNDYYCRLGATEILSSNGTSTSIDHLNKQIIISEQKEMPATQLFPLTKDLLNKLEVERYELLETNQVGEAKLQLLNNYHITCKEYTITYNKEKMKPQKLFVRLTNFEDPESREKEKTIALYIDQCDSKSKWEELGKKKFVNEVAGKWQPIEKYKDYKLYVL